MRRRPGGSSVTSRSPMRIRPASIFSSPASPRSSVVLPQPDGPSSTMNSRSATARLTSLVAMTLPNVLVTRSKRTPAIRPPFGVILRRHKGSLPREASSRHPAPHVEEVLADEEDDEQRRGEQEEPSGDAVGERRLARRRQDLRRQRAVPQREYRGGEHVVPGDDEDEDRRGRQPRERQREDDLAHRAEPAAAERHRRLLVLLGDASEDARRRQH